MIKENSQLFLRKNNNRQSKLFGKNYLNEIRWINLQKLYQNIEFIELNFEYTSTKQLAIDISQEN